MTIRYTTAGAYLVNDGAVKNQDITGTTYIYNGGALTAHEVQFLLAFPSPHRPMPEPSAPMPKSAPGAMAARTGAPIIARSHLGMDADEIAALARKHARLAREEAERLSSTDHEHAEEIAALVLAANAEPKEEVFSTEEDVADSRAWHNGWNAAAFMAHVKTTAKARRYHGIADLVLDAKGRPPVGKRRSPRVRAKNRK